MLFIEMLFGGEEESWGWKRTAILICHIGFLFI